MLDADYVGQAGLVDLLGYELDHLIRLPSTSKTTLVNLTHFNQRLMVRTRITLMGPGLGPSLDQTCFHLHGRCRCNVAEYE